MFGQNSELYSEKWNFWQNFGIQGAVHPHGQRPRRPGGGDGQGREGGDQALGARGEDQEIDL